MAVQLPSVTVHVLSPQTALDSHGHAATHAWTQRGPYAAHLSRPSHSEDHLDRERRVTGWQVTLAPEAWPVRQEDRLLVGDGRVLEVTGARLVPHLAGPVDLSHVSVQALELAEATTL